MKKQGRYKFVAGFVLGSLVFGSSAAFAAGLIVSPTTSKVFVNGQQVKIEAYNIDGSNYFKLRDIANVVGFDVDWDASANSIMVETWHWSEPEKGNALTEGSDSNRKPEQAAIVNLDEMKAELVRLTNIERTKAGLPTLETLPELMETAQLKADDMFVNRYFGHNSPVYGTPGEMIKSRIPNAKSAGENITSWRKSPDEAINSLMSSTEHRANILAEKYTHIGIGVLEGADGGYWFIQHFAKI